MSKDSLGVIAAGHEVTAQAGAEILRAGGNAYDAILAAVAVAFVAEPVLASPGGGGFLLAAPEKAQPLIYDFFVQTPGRRLPQDEIDFYPIHADFGGATQEFHIGLGSIAVPGQIKGMFDIHHDLGRMPMRDILAPAIQAAKKGVAMTPYQAYLLGVVQATFKAGEECKAIFSSRIEEDKLAQEGEVVKQPDLADFLDVLAIEGPDLFYKGEVAGLLDQGLREGGLIRAEDLAAYETIQRKPLELHYHDAYIEMNAPPASGGLLIGFGLKLLETAGLSDYGQGSAEYISLLAEVLDKTSLARAELEALAGDNPDCFLDEDYLRKYRQEILGRPKAVRGTTHISVIDKDHNLASMTVSNGEGCGYVVPGTGIVMNNMLGEEDLNPQGFHQWAPDTRLSSMMTPTTILWPDGRRIATGSGGSNRIRTALLQLLVNLIDYGMPVEDAVAAPRIHLENAYLNIEGGFEAPLDGIMKDWPDHTLWDGQNMFFGGTHTVGYSNKGFSGAGDPRRSGVCIVL